MGRLVTALTALTAIRRQTPSHVASTARLYASLSRTEKFLARLPNHEAQGLPRGARGMDLGRMHRLVTRLGDPCTDYKVVHVAGSKGKGSTATFLASIFRSAGLRTGLYTSPHVRCLLERIQGPSGRHVAAQELDAVFGRHESDVHLALEEEKGQLTHFEAIVLLFYGGQLQVQTASPAPPSPCPPALQVLTALAFSYFSSEQVDVAVVETGLGGTLDATNVIPRDSLAVACITSLGWEHSEVLGNSLKAIAKAKAGILKEGCPSLRWRDVRLGLLGAHQTRNASTAILTSLLLRERGWSISDQAIVTGLSEARLPGRFQLLSEEEARKLTGVNMTVVLDGAHTVASAEAFSRTLREFFPKNKLGIVVAMAKDKDHSGFAASILKDARPSLVVTSQVPIAGGCARSMDREALKEIFLRQVEALKGGEGEEGRERISVKSAANLETAVREAVRRFRNREDKEDKEDKEDREDKEDKEDRGVVLAITGSLHLVGGALTLVEEWKGGNEGRRK